MSKTAFTPGPWHITVFKDGDAFISDDGMEFIAHVSTREKSGEANAHLIAAAPDMYAALEEQIEAHKLLCEATGLDKQSHLDGTAQARAALARARGEQ